MAGPGRPQEYGDRVATNVRIERDTYAALKAAAKERDLSVNVLINLAIKELLPRLIPVEELRFTK